MKICALEGCNKAAHTKGLCTTHYARLLRNGTPYMDKPQYNFKSEWIEQSKAKGGLCAIEGCEREAKIRGICDMHYKRIKRNGTPYREKKQMEIKICSIEGCDKQETAKGLCTTHYKRVARQGTPYLDKMPSPATCTVPGCDNKHSGKGFCKKHYATFKKYGDPTYKKESSLKGKICAVEGCSQGVRSKSLCNNHYASFLRYKKKKIIESLEEYLQVQNAKTERKQSGSRG